MTIIDGKQISEQICNELSTEIQHLQNMQITPTLVIIQVGDNPASNIYVRNKLRLSDKLGAKTLVQKLPQTITQAELIKLINELNHDSSVNGILVQMPLPNHISENVVIESITPLKDVDCFHLINVGKL
jgi:methylenetetrahydrofolate dehydrogenase (NADP+)/methenyltetrahydrofolate cyclohydrolase